MTENEISSIVFDAGMKIHRKLGVGLYENVYEECLAYELKERGLIVERQKDIKVSGIYDDTGKLIRREIKKTSCK